MEKHVLKMSSAKRIGTAIVLMKLHANRPLNDCAGVSSFQLRQACSSHFNLDLDSRIGDGNAI